MLSIYIYIPDTTDSSTFSSLLNISIFSAVFGPFSNFFLFNLEIKVFISRLRFCLLYSGLVLENCCCSSLPSKYMRVGWCPVFGGFGGPYGMFESLESVGVIVEACEYSFPTPDSKLNVLCILYVV